MNNPILRLESIAGVEAHCCLDTPGRTADLVDSGCIVNPEVTARSSLLELLPHCPLALTSLAQNRLRPEFSEAGSRTERSKTALQPTSWERDALTVADNPGVSPSMTTRTFVGTNAADEPRGVITCINSNFTVETLVRNCRRPPEICLWLHGLRAKAKPGFS